MKYSSKTYNQCSKDIKEVDKTNEANATESLLKDVQAVTDLECLFRRLIKTRAILLNVLSN
ncbi:Protein P21 [Bienertia sinuspersici]